MRALTVLPGVADSARLDDVPEPSPAEGAVLIQGRAVGVCGTDIEILRGQYGAAPPGQQRLILGHESLGRVLEAPESTGLKEGDWVCSIVRHPDPVPCPSCAGGEWDMCQNGGYTEHGIKERHGFAAERYRMDAAFVVPVDARLGDRAVLLEPASVVAKAWDHVMRIGQRSLWRPTRVVVTGAGPIGLLAALMGVQRGLEVHVLDQVVGGPKPALVADLGATYHTGELRSLAPTDIILECTGAPALVMGAMQGVGPNGIVCLAGVSSGGRTLAVDAGALNRELVLENNVVFGSVNANRRHYQAGAIALRDADPSWLDRVLARRVPLDRWSEALQRQPDDVKTIITLS